MCSECTRDHVPGSVGHHVAAESRMSARTQLALLAFCEVVTLPTVFNTAATAPTTKASNRLEWNDQPGCDSPGNASSGAADTLRHHAASNRPSAQAARQPAVSPISTQVYDAARRAPQTFSATTKLQRRQPERHVDARRRAAGIGRVVPTAVRRPTSAPTEIPDSSTTSPVISGVNSLRRCGRLARL